MEATSSTSTPLATEVIMSTIQDTDISVLKKEIELFKAKNTLHEKKIRELKAKQRILVID